MPGGIEAGRVVALEARLRISGRSRTLGEIPIILSRIGDRIQLVLRGEDEQVRRPAVYEAR